MRGAYGRPDDVLPIDGKKAVVTGGASGMGAAIVEGYAACGVEVAIVDRNVALGLGRLQSAQVATRSEGRSTTSRRPAAVDRAVRDAHEKLGGLDILVNAAGAFLTGPAEELSDAEWDRVMKIIYGTFYGPALVLDDDREDRAILLHQLD